MKKVKEVSFTACDLCAAMPVFKEPSEAVVYCELCGKDFCEKHGYLVTVPPRPNSFHFGTDESLPRYLCEDCCQLAEKIKAIKTARTVKF